MDIKAPSIRHETIFHFLIVLACMNLWGKGSVLYLLFAVASFFRLKFLIPVNTRCIPVVLFSLVLYIASIFYYGMTEAIKSLNFMMLYLVGYGSCCRSQNPVAFIHKTIFSIFLGFSLQVVLMYLYNLTISGRETRVMYSIWTHERIAVTLAGLLACIITGYSFYVFFCTKGGCKKLLVAGVLLIALLTAFNTATRTPVVLFGILYIFMFPFYCLTQRSRRGVYAFLGVILLLCLFGVFYANNFAGLQDIIRETPLYDRLLSDGLETGRFNRFKFHAEHMLDHVWGGEHIGGIVGKGAHNYLQQAHDRYGIFAFFLSCFMTVQWLISIFRLMFKHEKEPVDYLLLSMYLAIIIQMCLEPVFAGYPILYWSLMLIDGMAAAYLRDERVVIYLK